MHRAICLYTYLAVGSCLRMPNAPEEQKCFGDDCVKLMDDIHYNSQSRGTFRNLPHLSNGLKSIYCQNGGGGCRLSYMVDGDATKKKTSLGLPTFYEIAQKAGTDKVDLHHYETLYQSYLGSLSLSQGKRFTFVEVGFATGRSAHAWHEWLGKADVHEFDVNCDQGWNKHETAPSHLHLTDKDLFYKRHRDLGYCQLHCGDGTNVSFIDEALSGVENPFVVVDDGGHSAAEMKASLNNWWPRIQPGGLFFMEDLAESYVVSDGFVKSLLKSIVQDVVSSSTSTTSSISKYVESIECMEQICVLKKTK